ncbi:MAG: lipopolysaccharide assembly protein LapA domain-containing protein, partial [Chloroflexota bacterium]
MAFLWLIVGAIVAVAAYAFGTQNAQVVDLSFFGVSILDVPLWLMVVTAALIGLVLGVLLELP